MNNKYYWAVIEVDIPDSTAKATKIGCPRLYRTRTDATNYIKDRLDNNYYGHYFTIEYINANKVYETLKPKAEILLNNWITFTESFNFSSRLNSSTEPEVTKWVWLNSSVGDGHTGLHTIDGVYANFDIECPTMDIALECFNFPFETCNATVLKCPMLESNSVSFREYEPGQFSGYFSSDIDSQKEELINVLNRKYYAMHVIYDTLKSIFLDDLDEEVFSYFTKKYFPEEIGGFVFSSNPWPNADEIKHEENKEKAIDFFQKSLIYFLDKKLVH